jgi:hypothetical protein
MQVLQGAIAGTLSYYFPANWLNMTLTQLVTGVFAYLEWNPWHVLIVFLLVSAAHVWYFWETVYKYGKMFLRLGLFYAALTLGTMILLRIIDLCSMFLSIKRGA